jgi:hypothetical protein
MRWLQSKYLLAYPGPGNIVKLGRVEYRVVEIGGLPKKSN